MNSFAGYVVVGIICLLVGLAVTPTAKAADPAFDALLAARSLKCAFGPGASAHWDSGKPKVTLDREGVDFILHFDSIDRDKRTARLIGNNTAADIAMFSTASGLHFLEVTGSGNVNFTTVFARMVSDGFISVTSRHLDLLRSPFPSQTHGTCKVWQ
jgi:hypothetical protein